MFMDEVRSAFKSGRYDIAKELLMEIGTEDYDSFHCSNISLCCLLLKEYPKAMQFAERAIEKSPNWNKGYLRKANVLFELKKYGQAIDIVLEGLQRCIDKDLLQECLLCLQDALTNDILNSLQFSRKKILTLDGGGIRGLVILQVLKQVEAAIAPKKIYEVFDLIVGTSTGGIIAVVHGLLKLSIDDCEQLYLKRVTAVFGNPSRLPIPSKHCSEGLDLVLKEVCGDITFTDLPPIAGQTPRVAVVATLADTYEGKPTLFCNYQHDIKSDYYEAQQNVTVREALRATSAAPYYFTPIEISGCTYVDGGLVANNPSLLALMEAHSIWNFGEFSLMSIGTGKRPYETSYIPRLLDNSMWEQICGGFLGGILSFVVRAVINSEIAHNVISTLCDKNLRYLRVNPSINEVQLDEISPCKLKAMLMQTENFLKKNSPDYASFFG